MAKEGELTESQKHFCREWVYDFNGSRAYKVAYPGVTDETARANASKLLTKDNVKDFCKVLQENLEELAGISRLKVLQEHQKLAFSSIAHLHDTWIERKEFESLTPDQKACIAEITTQIRKTSVIREGEPEQDVETEFVKLKLYDKQKALDSISKMLGYDAPKRVDVRTVEKQVIKIGGQEIEY
jgi:phage terminase small subunit